MWPPAGTGPSWGPWNPHLPLQADLDASSSAPDHLPPPPGSWEPDRCRKPRGAHGNRSRHQQPPANSAVSYFTCKCPSRGRGLHPTPCSADSAPSPPAPPQCPCLAPRSPHPMRPKWACALASPAGCGSLRQADWQFGGLLGPPCGHTPAATHKVMRTHAHPRCAAMSPPSCPEWPCLPWGMGGGWSLTSVCWGRQESGSWRVGQTREAWPAAPSLGPRRRSL